jgi:hypothetical protein
MAIACVAMARPDLNAFLNKKATSTKQLVSQAQSDPEVMDRFMRHFSMTREEVLNFLGGLTPGKLENDSVFRIYSVPNDGHVKVHIEKIKKGTGMFFTSSGSPALIMLCGNPVIPGADATLPLTPEAVDMSKPMRPVEIVTAPEDQLTTEFVQPGLPEFQSGGDALPIGSSIGALPAALAGLGAFAFVNHGGGSKHPPVPEPASMIALSVGVVGLVRKRRKK